MTFGRPARIVSVALLASISLVALVAYEGRARTRGQEVVLPIDTYDPRAPLTGHYVRFVIRDVLPDGVGCPPGTAFTRRPDTPKNWIALRRDGAQHRVAGVAATQAGARALGEVTVRGSASCIPPAANSPAGSKPSPAQVSIHIGIDRFHANQRGRADRPQPPDRVGRSPERLRRRLGRRGRQGAIEGHHRRRRAHGPRLVLAASGPVLQLPD